MAQEGQERSALVEQCGKARTRTAELRHAGKDTGMPHAKISCPVQRQEANRDALPSLILPSF